jgi:cytochrome c oxidase subunit 1
MTSFNYALTLPEFSSHKIAKKWLLLGVIALALAGLFAGLLVHGQRTHNDALFYTSLIIHVDLSVLVWFLAIVGMLWSLFFGQTRIPYLNSAAFWCFALGTICLPLASFVGEGEALMNNYVPIITNPIFILGIALLLTGTFLGICSVLIHVFEANSGSESPETRAQLFGLSTATLTTLISFAAWLWASKSIPPIIEGEQFYELLFWGGGHVLQLTHTQILMVVWLWLASIIGLKFPIPPRAMTLIYALGVLVALCAPLGYILYDITSFEHRQFFTHLMVYGNAVAPALVILALLWSLRNWSGYKRDDRALWSALICSLVLFSIGGLIGYKIDGSTVTIPAHYHGSIVGVTLAYMGLAYYLLPYFGLAKVTHWKLALVQPILYAVGQLCWIFGMMILGGYGAARKQAFLPEAHNSMVMIGNILKRSGDGLSLLGGLLFVVVVVMAVMKRKEANV